MIRHAKATLNTLRDAKRDGRKFSVLTCYDATTARLMEAAGVEVLLVGDTAAEVVLGLPGTRDIPVEFLLALTSAVRRGAPGSLLMGDLPYACRRPTVAATVLEAHRFMVAGADMVKVEVTGADATFVEKAAAASIPVVAHLGLLPQMLEPGETYAARGRTAEQARELIADAKRLESAGAAALLLEAVPSEVAREITRSTALPVIGCVAGPHCDGTVVVLHDMLGWGGGHPPRMVRRYENLADTLTDAFRRYVKDIQSGSFPTENESIHMRPGELEKLTAQPARPEA
jgi:3-methyl-2-oxobutanoate hydroxymethyltransferase